MACHHDRVIDGSEESADSRAGRDAASNEAARREMLRIDGARDLGTNLEQADALIRAAFELAGALRSRR
jgi:hypothetical protein